MRIIEHFDALPQVMYRKRVCKVIGTRFGESSIHYRHSVTLRQSTIYYDLIDSYGCRYENIHQSQVKPCAIEPHPEKEIVAVACNGAAQIIGLVVNNA